MKAINLVSAGLALAMGLPTIAAAENLAPFERGLYVAPMASYVEPDSDRTLDDGLGGTLALGYRVNPGLAIELYGAFSELDAVDGDGTSSTLSGGGIAALVFVPQLGGLHLPLAIGYLNSDHQGSAGEEYKGLSFEAGLGYLLPISFGRYRFGLRADARFRHHNGQDGQRLDEEASGIQDILYNLGLQLPFGLQPPPPPPPAPEPVVVAPADSDSDGVLDRDDQCPGTTYGSRVDERGCAPPPPPPPCPQTLENVDEVELRGCAAGDVIALRGVNFDTDKAELTETSEALLSEVAQQLREHPSMQIEVAGHTDNQGRASYNLDLSERRAQTVRSYLIERGVESSRLSTRGFGETSPMTSNDDAAGRALNRRVELRILDADSAG
ncbi:OmpA/MotB domain-containing protein [Oceanococcus atlanticus]|uniref:OmpA/MotB domain-containing protein n=1 Tax=Oceanococcus atlanticus TaxID=1317117 RepID=A0A1Y1SFR5_9GAMM|nr:OmpA family protein [Oceanococcus atlanticus]ORE88220.1 OmpA/MotB domain-containing protein [Oceanococcus atlanticus]